MLLDSFILDGGEGGRFEGEPTEEGIIKSSKFIMESSSCWVALWSIERRNWEIPLGPESFAGRMAFLVYC